jgi:hypothetical protein
MRRFFKGVFVVFIIGAAGFLVEFLYFGLLGNKNDSYQAADTIFILNGASERIKKGYEPEIRGRRTDVGGQWSEEGRPRA